MSWGMGMTILLGFDFDGIEAEDLDSIHRAMMLDLGWQRMRQRRSIQKHM